LTPDPVRYVCTISIRVLDSAISIIFENIWLAYHQIAPRFLSRSTTRLYVLDARKGYLAPLFLRPQLARVDAGPHHPFPDASLDTFYGSHTRSRSYKKFNAYICLTRIFPLFRNCNIPVPQLDARCRPLLAISDMGLPLRVFEELMPTAQNHHLHPTRGRLQESNSPVLAWEHESKVVPVEMANSIAIVVVLWAISDRTQEAAIPLLACNVLLCLEQ
jgi:hypothetical protein